MTYVEYRCKTHPEIKVAKGGEPCLECNEKVFSRWCKKCGGWAGMMGPHKHCPKCDSPPKDHELRNHSLMWHDGDVYCTKCWEFVRSWDAG